MWRHFTPCIGVILREFEGYAYPHFLKLGTVPPLLSATTGHLLSWNCAEMHGQPRFHPGPRSGSLQHSTRPFSSIKGPTSKGEGRGEVVPPLFGKSYTPCEAERYRCGSFIKKHQYCLVGLPSPLLTFNVVCGRHSTWSWVTIQREALRHLRT